MWGAATPRLSVFDVERYFALNDSDIAALNERFRRARAVIQPEFLRASGRTLDHVGALPRRLLADVAAWMKQDAAETLTMDELIQYVRHWLSELRILIPTERTFRDRSGWKSSAPCSR